MAPPRQHPHAHDPVDRPRAAVRPMPVAEFSERVTAYYAKAAKSTRIYTRHTLAFLRRSAETTAELTEVLVGRLIEDSAILSDSTRVERFWNFRAVCGLAVEWGLQDRNPCVDYPFSTTRARTPRGSDLDEFRVGELMAHLEAGAGTWKGHRLFALAATVVYSGLPLGKALDLKVGDCDLDSGKIRTTEGGSIRSAGTRPLVLPVDPALAVVLGRWIPRRREVKRAVSVQARYGMRLAEDGKTLLPVEAELAALALMKELRGEGRSLKRIADELSDRKIPTKRGLGRWDATTILNILNREYVREADPDPEPAAEARGEPRAGDDPLWLFPNIVGGYHWGHSSTLRDSPRLGLAEAGAALGVERLTFDSLKRFHLARSRASLGLAWVPAAPSPAPEPETPAVTPVPIPPVEILPDGSCRVRGVLKPTPLSKKRRLVVQALLHGGGERLTGATVYKTSGCVPGWLEILRVLKQSDPDWDAVIHFPGRGGIGYGISYP